MASRWAAANRRDPASEERARASKGTHRPFGRPPARSLLARGLSRALVVLSSGLGAVVLSSGLGAVVLSSGLGAVVLGTAVRTAEAQETEVSGTDTSSLAERPAAPKLEFAKDTRLTVGSDWPAGSIQDQLSRDPTMIPFGKGAVFVPAMTSGLDEPPVEVLSGEERVAEGTSGRRILLPPGTYTVRIGSGASQQRMSVQVTVREMGTTIIPVSWSTLSVHVVDENYGSLRASYELIRVSDREYIGIGFGTDEQAGEPVSTWVLRPGLYKIVRVGENYRARRDFVTVRLVEGKHTHFLLVLNPETQEFAGGGEVPAAELFRARKGVYGSLVVGGDVTTNIRSNALGQSDGISLAARGFIDGRLALEIFKNPFTLQLQVEEGVTNTPDTPIQTTIDRVDLDALYVYRFEPWVGPYVRFGVETNIFSGSDNQGEDKLLTRVSVDGSTERRIGDTTELSPPFGRIFIREGIGLNIRAFKLVFAEVNLRVGFGARHRIFRDVFELDRCDDFGPRRTFGATTVTEECTYREVQGNDLIGAETTLLGTFRFTRFVLINFELDALLTAPFADSVIDAEGSLAIKLTSFVSINYVVRYVRDASVAVGNPDRVVQDVLLRFSVDLL